MLASSSLTPGDLAFLGIRATDGGVAGAGVAGTDGGVAWTVGFVAGTRNSCDGAVSTCRVEVSSFCCSCVAISIGRTTGVEVTGRQGVRSSSGGGAGSSWILRSAFSAILSDLLCST